MPHLTWKNISSCQFLKRIKATTAYLGWGFYIILFTLHFTQKIANELTITIFFNPVRIHAKTVWFIYLWRVWVTVNLKICIVSACSHLTLSSRLQESVNCGLHLELDKLSCICWHVTTLAIIKRMQNAISVIHILIYQWT